MAPLRGLSELFDIMPPRAPAARRPVILNEQEIGEAANMSEVFDRLIAAGLDRRAASAAVVQGETTAAAFICRHNPTQQGTSRYAV